MIGWCVLGALSLQAAEPYRIMVVGDSISVGYTDLPKWTVPYEFGFRAGLYTRLTNSGMAVQFVGGSKEPWNGGSAGKYGVPTNSPKLDLRAIGQDHCEGYGGKKTGFIREHIAGWLAQDSPDIILLMVGINDIHRNNTNEPVAAEENLSNIVATVVQLAPKAHLIVAQITPYSSRYRSPAIEKYNAYIRDVLVPKFMSAGSRVTTVNQYANLLVPGTTNIDDSLYANGINHPNAAGYDRMAEPWFKGIHALQMPDAPARQ